LYNLRFFDEVLADVLQAKEWYYEQKAGLELEFANAILVCINRILQTPEIYSIRYKTIRIAHPKRFPYHIHFYLDDAENCVVITAIVHNKRDPRLSKKRL
jgi:plasmid stabilization system protein ParE